MTSPPEFTLSFLQQRPERAACVLDELDSVDVAAFSATIPARIAGPVVGYMLRWRAVSCIELLHPDKAAAIIESMDYYDTIGLMQGSSLETRQSILGALSPDLARKIKASLKYPEGTVGTLMDPSAPILTSDTTVDQALRYVRQRRRTDISHIFLRDMQGRLGGAVDIAALVRNAADTRLDSIADTQVSPVWNRATIASLERDPEWDDYPMRPVVGTRKTLLGGISRSALRHSLSQRFTAHAYPPRSGMLVSMLTIYLQGCQSLISLMTKSAKLDTTRAGKEAANDWQR